MPSGKQTTLLIWFVGLSVLVGLTVWYGAGQVGEAMVGAGWTSVLLVLLARVVAVGGAGVGWWLLTSSAHGAWRSEACAAPLPLQALLSMC
ncbi:MAG: hypothetical protein J0H89_03585 [Rhizobiales bacterium]|nr:hypothetical protein [Hyphomicrobiales bacterium]